MALSGIQIFKMLPKKNCKECGCPTCMAFSMKVAQGALKIEQCPHVSSEALEALSEATAPPMKTIKVGTGEGEYTLGGETVLYRHEKTYVNKTRYAVSLCSCMDDATIDAKIAAIPAVDYERIGERMHLEMIYVNYGAEAGADKYLELVKKAVATGKTLVLGCDDVEVAKAALEIAKAGKPILNGANASNYEAMNALAKEAAFFSIGTNDLTGYTMAVDRGNAKVAYLYSTYNPAVLRAIKRIIECCKKEVIMVGMCGEAAADSKLIPLLLAFGLDEFSVSATSVLKTRKTISDCTMDECKALADKVMACVTEEEVLEILG